EAFAGAEHRRPAVRGWPPSRHAAQHRRRHRVGRGARPGRGGGTHARPARPAGRAGRTGGLHRVGRRRAGRGARPGRAASRGRALGAGRSGAHCLASGRPRARDRGGGMRVLLLALLLANVAWFAWARFYGAQASPDAPLVSQQINRDAIKLLAPAQVASLAKPAACVEWGGIAAGDATRAEEALAPLALGDRLTERRSEESASWWVFVPALPTRQAAQQKAAELKRLGVEELFIIADEAKTRFPISLGVFRSEEAARSRLQELQARGVKTAQAGRRDTPFTRVYFQ